MTGPSGPGDLTQEFPAVDAGPDVVGPSTPAAPAAATVPDAGSFDVNAPDADGDTRDGDHTGEGPAAPVHATRRSRRLADELSRRAGMGGRGDGDEPGAGPRRPIPWGWIAVGVIALVLVVNGLVAAGRTTDSPEPSAAAPAAPATSTTPAAVTPEPTTSATPTSPSATTPSRLPERIILPRVTPSTATATTTGPSATATREPALTCRAGSRLDDMWPDGYNATITVTNTGDRAVDGWTLAFALPRGQRVVHAWNATVTSSHGSARATNADNNAHVAPGASVSFGIQVGTGHAMPGGRGGPSAFTLNGVTCS